MKKTIALLLALFTAMTLLTACSGGSASEGASGKDVAPKDLEAAIAAAYGESYLATMDIPEEMIASEFNLSKGDYKELVAKMPAIGFHPDRVVIVRANDGKGADIEAKFNKVKEDKINGGMNYPANLAKINATQVLRYGDTVLFLLVGAVDENMDATEEQAAKFAKDETAKAVAAVEKLMK